MTASIQTKKDKYYIVLNWKENGKRKQKWIKTDLSTTGNNKRKIEQKRIEVLSEWEPKITLHDNNILFADYLKNWLEETNATISTNTYFSYRGTIHNSICPYFEKRKIKLCDLKPYHIQEFYNHKMQTNNIKANTIHHYHANIHKALNYAVKTERIKNNPSDKIELPKKQKYVADYYTLDELKILLDNAKNSSIEVIVLLASWFGLRRGEIIGLKWDAVDFESKTLSVWGTMLDKGESGSKKKNLRWEPTTKTQSSLRSFPMPIAAIEYLQKLKIEQDARKKYKHYNHQWDEFVCVRKNGDIIPLEYVSRTFPNLCEKSGLKRLKLHELRHTNISLLLESGASMKELQEWAGHSSYSTTANIYSHIQAKTKNKLTESIQSMLG